MWVDGKEQCGDSSPSATLRVRMTSEGDGRRAKAEALAYLEAKADR